jgi:hypothetical protein
MAGGHTLHGKWSQPGVPHRGWIEVDVYDLGEPSQTCEMCEVMDIRYVHVVEHPEYPEQLEVGCVCAEHLTGDLVGPKAKEKKLKSIAKNKDTWSKKSWKMSAKGNPYLNEDGFNLVIMRDYVASPPAWRVRVANRVTGQQKFGTKRYPTVDDAKLGAFDALGWAREHLSSTGLSPSYR